MTNILLSLAFGFLIGYKKLLSEKMILLNGKFQTLVLLLLIFVMGMSIGIDREILTQLPMLGGTAFVFAVAVCLGSIVVVYVISRIFFKGEKKK